MTNYTVCKQNSEPGHALLHREPATVPGPWINGEISCHMLPFAHLSQLRGEMPNEDLRKNVAEQGCEICQQERITKSLVAKCPQDPRFQQPKFIDARAILAQNDTKHYTNKQRARPWTEESKQTYGGKHMTQPNTKMPNTDHILVEAKKDDSRTKIKHVETYTGCSHEPTTCHMLC